MDSWISRHPVKTRELPVRFRLLDLGLHFGRRFLDRNGPLVTQSDDFASASSGHLLNVASSFPAPRQNSGNRSSSSCTQWYSAARSGPRRKRRSPNELDIINPAACIGDRSPAAQPLVGWRARTATFQLFFRPAVLSGARANCPFSGPVRTNLSVGIVSCDLTHRRLRAS